MYIQATNKLIDQLKLKPADLTVSDEESFHCWHASFFILNRRKTIVLMNDATRYAVVIWGVKAKELQQIEDLIKTAIRQTFLAEGINPALVEQYLSEAGPVEFGKTKDRSMTGKLNQACDFVKNASEFIDQEQLIQTKIGVWASQYPFNDRIGGYTKPSERLYEAFQQHDGTPVYKLPVVELTVRLEWESLNVMRQLVVPLSKTFQELHEILQAAFGWQGYHLHNFTFRGKDGFPEVEIVDDEEAFFYARRGVTMVLDTEAVLADYLPLYSAFLYTYDFGDDWEHLIEVKEIRDETAVNYPMCTKMEGQTPPEDVGGVYGYKDFLKIIQNPNDPEYEEMREWAGMQGYREQSLKEINSRLKHL